MLYVLAGEAPDDYARFVMELYESGSSKLSDLEIRPRLDVLGSAPGPKEQAVDWISLVSIRDSQNSFLIPYTKAGKANWIPRVESLVQYGVYTEQTPGITLPLEVANWLKEAGYKKVVHKGQGLVSFKADGSSIVDEVNQYYSSGYHVILVIAAQLIQDNADKDSSVANHWVVLQSRIESDATPDKNVSFTVFTWGNPQYKVPPSDKKIKMEHFLKNFYGYIACNDYAANHPHADSTGVENAMNPGGQ